jgi:hypothetical protein
MSSPSDQVLTKMRQERQSGSQNGNQDPYSKLLIDKKKRRVLFLLSLLAFGFITLMFSRSIKAPEPWWVSGLGPVGIGLLLSLFPLTEFWEYKPWQSKTRQYEHLYSGK